MDMPNPKDRKIVKGADGFNYYADGTRVLPDVVANTKISKNDYIIEILEKIKNNPGYKLTDTDQRILDTISDTDPMKIAVRNRLNEMQTSKFNNESANQTGPVTVTTQEQYDALPAGSLFIEDGKTYRKP